MISTLVTIGFTAFFGLIGLTIVVYVLSLLGIIAIPTLLLFIQGIFGLKRGILKLDKKLVEAKKSFWLDLLAYIVTFILIAGFFVHLYNK